MPTGMRRTVYASKLSLTSCMLWSSRSSASLRSSWGTPKNDYQPRSWRLKRPMQNWARLAKKF